MTTLDTEATATSFRIRHSTLDPAKAVTMLANLGGASGAGLGGILSERNCMALVIEHLPEQVTNAVFIVNNQNMCHRFSIFKQQE